MDGEKLTKRNLPIKVTDEFLVSYKFPGSNIENHITFEAQDNKWKIISNGNVNIIVNDNVQREKIIDEYSFTFLKVIGYNRFIVLYAMPSFETRIYRLDTHTINKVVIGNSRSANIYYSNELTQENHATVSLNQGKWIIEANANGSTYLNGERITRKELNTGDIIFINGLIVIWMQQFIEINNPNNQVYVNGLVSANLLTNNNSSYTPATEDETNMNLYKDSDYFYRMPRLKENLEEKKISIDPPTPQTITEELPLWLTIGSSITMLGFSIYTAFNLINSITSGTSTLLTILPQFLMMIFLILGSVVFPQLTRKYQKNRNKAKEALRQSKYQEYLKTKSTEIENEKARELRVLDDNNPNVAKVVNIIQNRDRKLWERSINDSDFLEVRLGIGTIKSMINIQSSEKRFSLDEDNLINLSVKTAEESKLLNNAPITISLIKKNNLAFLFNCTHKQDYINGIITQIITYNNPDNLKIVVLTNKENKNKWDYLKNIPHTFADDHSIRFFAVDEEEAKDISTYIADEIKKRKEIIKNNAKEDEDDDEKEIKKDLNYQNFDEYYLIITDSYSKYKSLPIFDNFANSEDNLGFSLLSIADTMKNIPSECSTYVEIGEKDGTILSDEYHAGELQYFVNEFMPEMNMNNIGNMLSNIPVAVKDSSYQLPNSISFLEMYGVSKIEQLNSLNRWKSNNPIKSLSVPVGVHKNGDLFYLDLHEKYHGPHGLIAGMTGSGKSEFIITYILSMAANFHPYEVQFVLIDYKGGGLAGAFENKEAGIKLPHVIGTITNLDVSTMNRTLVSIQSELKRRQKVFNETRDALGEGTIDIYKYQRLYREGKVKKPMSHLFIISDEFAELKAQQPDFMDELISTARIGRSLGVHLILATQKPTGVVNDQIWSNSKFKVCLKVQDKSDSNEMLKRPEAASIKETGRFYLQVGYDDYFDIGQSGWSGAKYVPADQIIKKVNTSIDFIGDTGYIVKSIDDEVKTDTKDYGDQLVNTVKYICDVSKREGIQNSSLWLPALSENIYIDDVKKKYNYRPTPYFINPVIGEYDRPSSQEQGILNLNLTDNGNTIIYGLPGSGKENLLSTIIWSSIAEHTPDEINYYIIDCGSETLKIFSTMPHVGEVATSDDGDKIVDIFKMMNDEMGNRKELFSNYGGTYKSYISNSGKKLPLYVVIINGYESFVEMFGKLSEDVTPLYRDAAKYGIIFIISTTSTSSIRSRISQNFSNKILLQLSDTYDYRSILGAPKSLVPAKFFGRGVALHDGIPVEFQTAQIYLKDQLQKVILGAAEKLNAAYTSRATKVLIVPNKVILANLINDVKNLNNIPIGYSMNSRKPYYFDFTNKPVTTIIGNEISSSMSFIYALTKEFKTISNSVVRVIDFTKMYEKEIDGVKVFNNNFDNIIYALKNEITTQSSTTNIYIIVGIGQIEQKLSPDSATLFNELMTNIDKYSNKYFVFVDSYISYRNIQLKPWYNAQVTGTNGIWVGEGVGNQLSLQASNITYDDRRLNFPYMAFAIEKGISTTIKYVVDEGDNNEK